MSNIAVPQVYVFQEFTQVPTDITQPLRPVIVGPEYKLHRYQVNNEKTYFGDYDPFVGNVVSWESVGKDATSSVDLDYVDVYLEDAKLRYWDSNSTGTEVKTALDSNNIVQFDINIAQKGTYALDATMYGRDVRPGDFIRISATVASVNYTHEARIVAIRGEKLPAVIGGAQSASTNKATNAAVAPVASVLGSGTQENLEISGEYDGTGVGVLNEVYTVIVRKGSTGLNPSTAVLDIISASGKDSVYGFVPASTDYDTPMPLGNNGLLFNFSEYEEDDLQVGWSWSVSVSQEFTKPTVSSGGTFTGSFSTNYIVKVVRGGDVNAVNVLDRPVVQVTTSSGVDASPSAVLSSTSTSVGNFGVTITFDEDILCAGDQYFIPVTESTEGALNQVLINRAIPSAMISTGSDTVLLSAELMINKTGKLNKELFNYAVQNWSVSDSELTLNPDAMEYDNTWRSGDYALPVVGGQIFATWRELIKTNSSKLHNVNTLLDLNNKVTTQLDSPDNPLGFALLKALQNSGGNTLDNAYVRFVSVESDDTAGYSKALDTIDTSPDAYCIVPLSDDPAVLSLVSSLVNVLSTPDIGEWKIALFGINEGDSIPVVVTDSLNQPVQGTVNDGLLTVSTPNIDFLSSGVEVGDHVRINYTKDKYANDVYESYKVLSVETSTTLQLQGAPDVVLESKFEVHRDKTPENMVQFIGNKSGEYSNRRIYWIYPEEVLRVGGVPVDSVFGAAAVGGLVGASAPQQGLSNAELQGFDLTFTTQRYTKSQLNEIAGSGVMILSRDKSLNSLIIRHQLSSDTTDLNSRELSVVKNVDSISFLLQASLRRYIGRANLTPYTLADIRTEIINRLDFLAKVQISPSIGGQVLDGTEIEEIRVHPVLRDRVIIRLRLVIPYPINYIELYLVV